MQCVNIQNLNLPIHASEWLRSGELARLLLTYALIDIMLLIAYSFAEFET